MELPRFTGQESLEERFWRLYDFLYAYIAQSRADGRVQRDNDE